MEITWEDINQEWIDSNFENLWLFFRSVTLNDFEDHFRPLEFWLLKRSDSKVVTEIKLQDKGHISLTLQDGRDMCIMHPKKAKCGQDWDVDMLPEFLNSIK